MLERYINDELDQSLLSWEDIKLFPCYEQREAWNELHEEIKHNFLKKADEFLGYEWPILTSVLYMDYVRNGDRQKYEELYFKRRSVLGTLVVAECIDGSGKYLDDIINGIWIICEETSWTLPAHNKFNNSEALPDIEKPFIDLFAAETGALLAWTYYLLKRQLDNISKVICNRIGYELKKRILDPYLEHDDFWWMGFLKDTGYHVNNWNPWCNSNCLTAFLIMEEDFNRRLKAVKKCMRSLDIFLKSYKNDGGCDEGTSYWVYAGGSLFDCLEMLFVATGGLVNIYNEPLIKNIGQFIYRTHISKNYYINFADGSAKVYIPSELVYRYGLRIGDRKLCDLGAYSFHLNKDLDLKPKIFKMFRILSYVFNYKTLLESKGNPPFERDIWMDGIQVMAARENKDTDIGMYIAAKGGHNNESHNHNDVGQFIIYCDGQPIIIDVGVETYTANTFNVDRYKIWTMQSAYHNLPTVNDIQQKDGDSFRASDVKCQADDTKAELVMNIATAYPQAAGIEKWERTCRLNRGEHASVEIKDNFRLKNPYGNIKISFMTCCKPLIDKPGRILLRNEQNLWIVFEFEPENLSSAFECINIEDQKLREVWGNHIYRITLCCMNAVKHGIWGYKFYRKSAGLIIA